MRSRIQRRGQAALTALGVVLVATIAELALSGPAAASEASRAPSPAVARPAAASSRAVAFVRSRAPEPAPTLDDILHALRVVETGGEPRGGRDAVGDGGAAIGPYQIHREYWRDANVPGSFSQCRDARYARRVVIAYWKRYCPDALEELDAEVLARTHNGGPAGARKAATLRFWRKVQRELER
jgi:hypothetical protein